MFASHSNLKFLQLLLNLSLLLCSAICFPDEDRKIILGKYGEIKSRLVERAKSIPREMFEQFFEANIFKRLSNMNKFLRHTSEWFSFQCDYVQHQTGKNIRATVKLIFDSNSHHLFNMNLTWAQKMGIPMRANFDPRTINPNSLDPTKNLVQADLRRMKDPSKMSVNQFYEMEWIPLRHKGQIISMTVLVTADWLQTLGDPMFSKGEEDEEELNTVEFLRIYARYLKAAVKLNRAGILHGDHNPWNVVLRMGKGRIRSPAIVNFELMGVWSLNAVVMDNQLRYAENYRAPSIEEGAVKHEDPDEDNSDFVNFYPYDKGMREDTFALAVTFKAMVKTNSAKIEEMHPSIQNILRVIDEVMMRHPFNLENVPTTAQWAEIVEQLIAGKKDYAKIVRKYLPIEEVPIARHKAGASDASRSPMAKMESKKQFANMHGNQIPIQTRRQLINLI